MNKMDGNRIPLTNIQKIIARRMLSSKQSKPCFYLKSKADVTDFVELRPMLRKKLGAKVTTNAFYIHALAQTVTQFPLMAGRMDGDNIKISENVNVGFAVSAPQGLVVPVIKKAETKSIVEISLEEKLLTDKSRSNDLKLDEITGESVALSNLGAYDLDDFIAIVPPDASCILSVGKILREIVPLDGNFVERKFVTLWLAVDHRTIDSLYAARFLQCVREMLEKPHAFALGRI